MSRHSLSSADLRRLADAVDPVGHGADGEFLPGSVLTSLAELIGCDETTFQVMNVRRYYAVEQNVHGDDGDSDLTELLELFWSGFWNCLSCSYPQRTGDYARVTRLSDFHSRADVRHWRMGAFFARVGVRHEMMLPLSPDGELDRRILFFGSSGADFCERDVLTLSLLHPHVFALHLRQRRRVTRVPALTPAKSRCWRWSRPDVRTSRWRGLWACRRRPSASTWRTPTLSWTSPVARQRSPRSCRSRPPADRGQAPMPTFDDITRAQQAMWSHGDFHRIGVAQIVVGELLVRELQVHAGERVLDVAGGAGNTALAAARRFADVTCSDYVPELLAHARARADVEGLALNIRVTTHRPCPSRTRASTWSLPPSGPCSPRTTRPLPGS